MRRPAIRAHHLRGASALLADQIETALAYLRQAMEIFQRLGMALDAERVRTRLDELTKV